MPTWSGLWNRQYNESYAPLSGGNTADYNNTFRDQLNRHFRGVHGRKMGALLRALTGAAVGAQATSIVRQIPASPDVTASFSGGGKITAVNVTEINRPTTAADETYIDSTTNMLTAPIPYPVDKSGNGGYKGPGVF